MCDFHNFGLIFTGQCTVCLKSMFFEKNSNGGSLGAGGVKKFFQKTLILVFATTQNTFFDIFMRDQNHENHTLCSRNKMSGSVCCTVRKLTISTQKGKSPEKCKPNISWFFYGYIGTMSWLFCLQNMYIWLFFIRFAFHKYFHPTI